MTKILSPQILEPITKQGIFEGREHVGHSRGGNCPCLPSPREPCSECNTVDMMGEPTRDIEPRGEWAKPGTLGNVMVCGCDNGLMPCDYLEEAERIVWLHYPLHVGNDVARLAQTNRFAERVFAAKWREQNKMSSTLSHLLADRARKNFWGEPIQEHYSERDAFVAATFAQWLGTNVGRCFLEDAMRTTGYVVYHEPMYFAEPCLCGVKPHRKQAWGTRGLGVCTYEIQCINADCSNRSVAFGASEIEAVHNWNGWVRSLKGHK